jgi:hypothetical protein
VASFCIHFSGSSIFDIQCSILCLEEEKVVIDLLSLSRVDHLTIDGYYHACMGALYMKTCPIEIVFLRLTSYS